MQAQAFGDLAVLGGHLLGRLQMVAERRQPPLDGLQRTVQLGLLARLAEPAVAVVGEAGEGAEIGRRRALVAHLQVLLAVGLQQRGALAHPFGLRGQDFGYGADGPGR